MKCEVIVLAGGKGSRLGSGTKKQYIKIFNKDILFYTLEKFEKLSCVSSITVVCVEEEIEYIKEYGFSKITKFATAGEERMYSVYNALKSIDEDTDIVIIHDGVRPFFDDEKIQELIQKSYISGGGIYAVKSIDTIKKVINNSVVETINRDSLYNVQTPQAFKKDLIIKAYEYIIKNNIICTDDSMVVEKSNTDAIVEIVESDYNNIKITTKIDLKIAEAILGEKI